MFKVTPLLFLLAMLAWPVPLTAQTQTGRGGGVRVRVDDGRQRLDAVIYEHSYALLIGNSAYVKWNSLPGVRQDLVAVANALTQQGFEVVSFDERDEPVTGRLALNVTRGEFNRQMELFVDRYGQDVGNRLLVYYAGHGYTAKMPVPDDRVIGYLVMSDAPVMPAADDALDGKLTYQQLRLFNQTSVTAEEVRTFARRMLARHALFVFDSCFAGTMLFRDQGPKVPPYISAEVTQPVREFLTAGDERQLVSDDSAFRKAFVKGIEGAADTADRDHPRDGYVLATELYLYVKKEVGDYSGNTQTPRFGKILVPELDRGDFVFTVNPTVAVTTEPAHTLPPLPTMERPAARVESGRSPVRFEKYGLQLSQYCSKRFGPNSIPVYEEGNAYSWRCMVKNANQQPSYNVMSMIEACRDAYGPGYGPTVGDMKQVMSWSCVEAFTFDYREGTIPGERLWTRTGENDWVENLPDGTHTCFKVVGQESLNGSWGTVVKRCDSPMEVLIPDAPRMGRQLLFRQNSSGPWQWLGVIR